jgi:hypothetical protein
MNVLVVLSAALQFYQRPYERGFLRAAHRGDAFPRDHPGLLFKRRRQLANKYGRTNRPDSLPLIRASKCPSQAAGLSARWPRRLVRTGTFLIG